MQSYDFCQQGKEWALADVFLNIYHFKVKIKKNNYKALKIHIEIAEIEIAASELVRKFMPIAWKAYCS